MRILWLDDYRNPFLNKERKVPLIKGTLYWVRSYEEFVEWINKFGLPDVVSFDHDLSDQHYAPQEYWGDYEKSKAYQEAQTYTEKTGADCAKFLIQFCMDNNRDLPVWYVHSANPVGADNIRAWLTNFEKHQHAIRV